LTRVDVRAIVNDDDTLEEGILPALQEYNLAQFIVVDVPGADHQVSSNVEWLVAHLWNHGSFADNCKRRRAEAGH
jgi:hypothetical protein